MKALDRQIQDAIVKARHARRERDMQWHEYAGTVLLAAIATVAIMLCIPA